MRLHQPIAVVIVSILGTQAFTVPSSTTQKKFKPFWTPLYSESEEATESTTTKKPKTLGLLTFDLDDTLYPISPVISEANEAFAKAMANFGFEGIRPGDIENTGRQMREEMAVDDPKRASALSHTEIRMMAIRKQMETVIFLRSLENIAEDEATSVSSLSPIIVNNAKRWATKEVSSSVVQAVYNAWEMERHHAGERHVYPEIIECLKQIKEEHPNIVVGAVTDGKANPMLMTFTCAPYFDFCMSWEDDMGAREKFFQELSDTDSEVQLKWIYEAALEKYAGFASARGLFKDQSEPNDTTDDVWIHIGDDLAYDVGGSAACGAKTILMELADKYDQTARHRFTLDKQPSWSVTMDDEIETHRKMNLIAEQHVDKRVGYISGLKEAINEILAE